MDLGVYITPIIVKFEVLNLTLGGAIVNGLDQLKSGST